MSTFDKEKQAVNEEDFALIANTQLENFSVIRQPLIYTDRDRTTIFISEKAMADLNLKVGDTALVYALH